MSRKRQREDASEDDVFVYYDHTDPSTIPSSITSLRIDSSVRRIPPRAFREQKSLTNVEYEEGLQAIGEQAFSGCTGLREQQFPSTLIEIGIRAFWECKQLESVGRLPLSLTIIKKQAFCDCTRLHSIETSNDTLRLEEGVFENCASLTHFRLPQGMVTIPHGLFCRCSSLADINVPSSVIEIGGHAFAFCYKLAEIELPAGLKTIGGYSFGSAGLKRFRFPPMVERIGGSALSECKYLESVILPDTGICIPQSVVRIEEGAFSDCDGLTQLDLSRFKITSIGPSAFARCSNLRNVMLPRSTLKKIEELTFQYCESLTHLWVPPTVEYIDECAFAGCTSLLSVEVPETLKRLIFVYDFGNDDMEVCGYESLVNIYLPRSHKRGLLDVETFEFMQEMKLGEAEGNYSELVGKLKRRFNSLPLHKACYFQSYHSLQENIKRIQSIVQSDEDGPKRACGRVDFLGMTPFHILALSHRPWLNLFQELLSASKSSADIILNCRDVFGCTPLDYLCKNIRSPLAISVTKSLLLQILEPRISFLGLELWRDDITSDLGKILQMATTATVEDEIFSLARLLRIARPSAAEDVTIFSLGIHVTSLCQKLAKLERMEALSLLEMSVWKMKIDEATSSGSDAEARDNCRINCGSKIVLESVITLLGDSRATPSG